MDEVIEYIQYQFTIFFVGLNICFGVGMCRGIYLPLILLPSSSSHLTQNPVEEDYDA